MDVNIKNLLLQSRKPSNGGKIWGFKNQLPLLTLLHFSDIHGDGTAMSRICDFMEEYGDCVEDCICTGDVLEGRWLSDFTFWGKDKRASTVLSCIGNHDVLADDKGWNWEMRVSQEECYKRLFAPFISGWGCVYQENKTFYYKDYPKNTVRLIVLNSILIDEDRQEQLKWLETVLNSALESNLHVVIAMHYPIYMKKIPCNFSTLDRGDGLGDKSMSVYQQKVADFIDKGGNFVSWLAGHVHMDYIGYNEEFPNQLCIAIDALSCYQSEAYNDADRTEGMPSQDLYNLVTIDTFDKLIKIVRVGSNLDRYLRKKDTLCINYKTFEVIK